MNLVFHISEDGSEIELKHCASFSYPCGYFLTRGISASNLNQIFWQRVSLFQAHSFTVLVTYCNEWLQRRQQFNYKPILKENINIPIRSTTSSSDGINSGLIFLKVDIKKNLSDINDA